MEQGIMNIEYALPLFPAPYSVFAFMIRLNEKISNTEQGIMNTEYALLRFTYHPLFPAPCSVFAFMIRLTRNHEY